VEAVVSSNLDKDAAYMPVVGLDNQLLFGFVVAASAGLVELMEAVVSSMVLVVGSTS